MRKDRYPIQIENQFRDVVKAALAVSRLLNTSVNPKEEGRGSGLEELPNLSCRLSNARTMCVSTFIQSSASLFDIRNCFSDPSVPPIASCSLIFGIQQSFSNGSEMNDGEIGIKLLQPNSGDHHAGCVKWDRSNFGPLNGNGSFGGMTTRLKELGE